MTSSYKDGSVWKKTTPYVNVDGNWKIAKSAWSNVSSEWKSWFLQGGLNDGGFTTFDNYNGFISTEVNRSAIQPDGKIIVVGNFIKFNGIFASRLIRLNLDGTIDNDFLSNIGTGANAVVYRVAIQSDGKIIITGNFTTFNGVSANRIIRLNIDGTTDTSFLNNIGTGANSHVLAIAIQPDGKIIVGGGFTTFNNVSANRIIRINSDGTSDTTFNSTIGTGASDFVRAIAIESDTNIIIAGDFVTFNSATVNKMVRLSSSGIQDTSFTTNIGSGPLNREIYSIAIQPDGKILVGGSFRFWRGNTASRLIRLNVNGTVDTAFSTNIGLGPSNGDVVSVIVKSDGKIIITGSWTIFNNIPAKSLVCLNSNGTLDFEFNNNLGTSVDTSFQSVSIQSDEKLVVVGNFSVFNGTSFNGIVRLNSNGTRDTPFPNNTGTATSGPTGNGIIESIAIQPDGKILLGGYFTTFNGIQSSKVVRLLSDGSIDTNFVNNIGVAVEGSVVSSIAIQPDGKILLGGYFTGFNYAWVRSIVRLNSDGTIDFEFIGNTGQATEASITAITVLPNGKILLSGYFTTFNGIESRYIVCLNQNGTRDDVFNTNIGTGLNSNANQIRVQPDEKILLGGNFTTFNGLTVNKLVRLNLDGTRDSSFSITQPVNNGIASFVTLDDGRIIVVGDFTTFNGLSINNIVCLNSDGTLNTTFNNNIGIGTEDYSPTVYKYIASVEKQNYDQIIIVGIFTKFNCVTVNCICRLNLDGTLDVNFTQNAGIGLGVGSGTSDYLTSVALQADGKIIIGGRFSSFNNITRTNIARIGGDIAL
jgi:uncharacterized delta-60 repeat protein